MAAMFDPVYVTEVFNDILSRRGLQMTIELKKAPDSPAKLQEDVPTYSVGNIPGKGASQGNIAQRMNGEERPNETKRR